MSPQNLFFPICNHFPAIISPYDEKLIAMCSFHSLINHTTYNNLCLIYLVHDSVLWCIPLASHNCHAFLLSTSEFPLYEHITPCSLHHTWMDSSKIGLFTVLTFMIKVAIYLGNVFCGSHGCCLNEHIFLFLLGQEEFLYDVNTRLSWFSGTIFANSPVKLVW